MSKSTPPNATATVAERRPQPFGDVVAVYPDNGDAYHLCVDGEPICGQTEHADPSNRENYAPNTAARRGFEPCAHCLRQAPKHTADGPPTEIPATGTPKACQLEQLQHHPQAALALPEPAPGVPMAELKDRFDKSTLYSWLEADILKERYSTRYDPRYAGRGHLWGADANCYAWVEDNIDVELTPCGNAAGVRNLRDEAGYTCTDESCDCRFDRETAKEVVK